MLGDILLVVVKKNSYHSDRNIMNCLSSSKGDFHEYAFCNCISYLQWKRNKHRFSEIYSFNRKRKKHDEFLFSTSKCLPTRPQPRQKFFIGCGHVYNPQWPDWKRTIDFMRFSCSGFDWKFMIKVNPIPKRLWNYQVVWFTQWKKTLLQRSYKSFSKTFSHAQEFKKWNGSTVGRTCVRISTVYPWLEIDTWCR